MYNIEIKWDGNPNVTHNLSQQLYYIHEITWEYFHDSLKTSKKYQQYLLKERLIRSDMIREFQLGYSPNNWQGLLNRLKNKKISNKAIHASGLIIPGKKGEFDRFRNRIMFSLINERGKICGFAGRTLDLKETAKYMNSPESPIYQKSNFLYGLNKSKNFIPKKNQALVVEGYLDLIQLYQNNYQNSVAVSGTSFTQGHAKKLKRYSENVVLIFDGDSAGIQAAIRSGYILTMEGISPKIIELPKGYDPDDMMTEGKQNEFEKLLKNAKTLIEFHFTNFKGGTDSTNQLNSFARESILEISKIDDAIFRELMIRELANVSKFREENLYEKLTLITNRNKNRSPKMPIKKTDIIPQFNKSRRDKIEEEITQLCFVKDPKIRRLLYDHVQPEWFANKHYRHIFDKVYIHLYGKITPDANVVMDGLNESDQEKLSDLIFQLDEKNPTMKLAIDCLIIFESLDLKSSLNKKREELKNNLHINKIKDTLKKISDIQNQINEIKSKYE